MQTKKFGDKEITIRELDRLDLEDPKKFQIFINSLIEEDVKILVNQKASIDEEVDYVRGMLEGTERKNKVYLLAEHDDKIVGSTSIELEKWRKNHIGIFAIAIIKEYRGLGLGKYLMSEIINSAKRDLNPVPQFIQLEAYINNKPAVNLYKKMGFKAVAKIPNQIKYKDKLITELVMMRPL